MLDDQKTIIQTLIMREEQNVRESHQQHQKQMIPLVKMQLVHRAIVYTVEFIRQIKNNHMFFERYKFIYITWGLPPPLRYQGQLLLPTVNVGL